MKYTLALLFFTLCFCVSSQEYYLINAKSGLNVRSNYNLSSKKVAKIPFGVLVEKIEDTNKALTVNDNGKKIKGTWVKIKYNNYDYLVSKETKSFESEGYVFDGFLKKFENDTIIITKNEVEKTEYDNLLKVASKKTYNLKKISTLDSIKDILKNRVEWVTEFEDDMSIRDDAIKSIITDNGQKLIMSENHIYETGFSKGWSGYYQEEGILVLEGGHNSDVCFSIKTGETDLTIGNPDYIVPSPKNTYRLNGYFSGQECVLYFFQKKEKDQFTYLTKFNWDYDVCTFKTFYWINETKFIYSKMNYSVDSVYGTQDYFVGEIKTVLKSKTQVALEFVNNYKNFCDTKDSRLDDIEWSMKQSNVSESFKEELKKILLQAEKDNPEMGLGFDPIFDAQDYPNDFEIDKADVNSEYISLKGKNWSDFKLKIRLILKNNIWLVDGAGIVNITKIKTD